MFNSLSSNVIGAKAKAIYGKRLTEKDYHELARQRSVSDVTAYLKNNTDYAKALSGINESLIHRGHLEVMLHKARLDRYLSLARYDLSGSSFYHFIITDAEVSVILRTVMLLNAGSTDSIITTIPSYMQEYVSFDFIRLSKIKTFDDMLSVLSTTPYANILKDFRADIGKINLSGCEHALKCYYYETILKDIDKNYVGKTHHDLRKMVLIEVEMINLSLIYRLKTYFKRSPAEIRSILLPYFYKLTPERIDELLNAENDADFIQKMNLATITKKMNRVTFSYFEDYTTRLLSIISHTLMRFSTSAPVVFYCFMTLNRIELQNIITIIEGIRYENPPAEIEKLLILE